MRGSKNERKPDAILNHLTQEVLCPSEVAELRRACGPDSWHRAKEGVTKGEKHVYLASTAYAQIGCLGLRVTSTLSKENLEDNRESERPHARGD